MTTAAVSTRIARRLPTAFALAVVLNVPVALAQPCIPSEIVQKISLTESDRQSIRSCVNTIKDGLAGDDTQVRRARSAIVDLFRARNASVAFRVELGRMIEPVLAPLVADKRELVAANALQVAGEVGTQACLTLALRAMDDPRPAVRYAAAYACKLTFEGLRDPTGAAVQAADVARALREIAGRMATEKDPRVLEGDVRAFEAAVFVPEGSAATVRATSVAELVKVMSSLVLKAKSDGVASIAPAAVRAGQVLRNATTGEKMDANEPAISSATLREIGGYGGDLMAVAKCRLAAGEVSPDERSALEAMVRAGVNVYFFANSALGGSSGLDRPLGDLIRDGDSANFAKQVDEYIGANGVLTKPPFGLPAARFGC
ncbi:MAG: hypothetical protein KF745_05145 [Phycisphaeraceae bacterium]|nr:hypothetical protein [Phycisphaeraceae bacterium]